VAYGFRVVVTKKITLKLVAKFAYVVPDDLNPTIRAHDNRERIEIMETTLPAFTPIEESLFLTRCGRALDNRSPHPILADTMADEIVRKLVYDCTKFRLSASPIINIALRAKKLDEVALEFVTRHPDAVALDLGAGLDTRMFRIAPPSTVDWYDVNFPEVIAARQQLIPGRANAHGVGADLTDPNWLDAIPTDRP